MSRTRQRGMTLVEFAIAGGAVLIALFACLEISRLLYVWNTLGESTRRAARLAVVCPLNHVSIVRAALLNGPDNADPSHYVAGMTSANVSVEYLSAAGAATSTYAGAAFVRVSISGLQHQLMIPFMTRTLEVPPFSTTLPIESLGYVPGADERNCPGG